jgi:hypothetical protein
MDPVKKAELNAQIERLALQAEEAGNAGDSATVGKAHSAIDDAMMEAKRAAAAKTRASNPRLQEIRSRLDAIEKEKRTVAGAWREEELDDEIAALMAERRQILGKAPKEGQGVTLSANGAPRERPSYKKRYQEAVARGEILAPDAPTRAPAAMIRKGELVDRDAVAKALSDIYEANDYALPRNYATQIAKQLGRNPQSIRRTLFNMREAGDPRVAEIGKYDGPQDFGVLNTGRKLALPLAMTGGQAYVADRYRRENGYQMGLQ